jgi:CheY-like chemotaxis protein
VSDSLNSTWNGIVGKMELRATTPVWLDDVQVFPDVATRSALVKVWIGNATGKAGSGKLSAGSGQDGVALINAHQPAAVIIDLALPDMSGWEVFIRLRDAASIRPAPPVIILADQGTRLDRTFSLQVAQVHDYQMKPFLPSQLQLAGFLCSLQRLLSNRRYSSERYCS